MHARPPYLLPLLALVVVARAPLGAQSVVLDEGAFRLSRGGAEIGTETFTIRRIGQGADAHVIANAVVELDLPSGHEQIRPLLQTASDLSVSAYQIDVAGQQPVEMTVTLNGRRFVARTRTPAGEQEREFRASPGSVLLEGEVAHQYWFLSQLPEGTDVNVLLPRAGTQERVVVRAVRSETLEVDGASIPARRSSLEIDGTPHEVWYDAEGRVLKVSVPATGFTAERVGR